MQKDFHFYATLALAINSGRGYEESLAIAWANQFTDECNSRSRGIRTQIPFYGGWIWKSTQRNVIIPFHFPPGKKFVVVENSLIARDLIYNADNPIALGIALHTLQDTYSHQNFTGWSEEFNSCFTWKNLWRALVPNIGHSDMGVLPDIADASWYDPRTKKIIHNRTRATRCLTATNNFLGGDLPEDFLDALIFDYDGRKNKWLKTTGRYVRYSKIKEVLWLKYMKEFRAAATVQRDFVLAQV